MEETPCKMDIIDNAIKKLKQLESIGAAISYLGEDNDKNQCLEWYGEGLGDVVKDLSQEILKSLEQNWKLMISGSGQEEKGSLPHIPEDGSKEPEVGSLRSEAMLRVAHG